MSEHGQLAERGDRVQCHECGRWMRDLRVHIPRAHTMHLTNRQAAAELGVGRSSMEALRKEVLGRRGGGTNAAQNEIRRAAEREAMTAVARRLGHPDLETYLHATAEWTHRDVAHQLGQPFKRVEMLRRAVLGPRRSGRPPRRTGEVGGAHPGGSGV